MGYQPRPFSFCFPLHRFSGECDRNREHEINVLHYRALAWARTSWQIEKVESVLWAKTAVPGAVWGQILGPDRASNYSRPCNWTERYFNVTLLVKAQQPGLCFRWWARVGDYKPRRWLHCSSQTDTKASAMTVSCRRNKAQRGACHDHTPKGQTQSLQQIHCSFSSKTGLFNDAHCESLPVGCTAEAHFENEILMAWVRTAKISTEFSVLSVAPKHSSVSAFLQAAMIPARRGAEGWSIPTGNYCLAQYRHRDIK